LNRASVLSVPNGNKLKQIVAGKQNIKNNELIDTNCNVIRRSLRHCTA